MSITKKYMIAVGALALSLSAMAQSAKSFEVIKTQHGLELPYSAMDSWITRSFKESGVIGGKTRVLYEVGKTGKIDGPKSYINMDSPWATSNVYAKVKGITKGSTTVFPEKRGDGYAARLETRLEEVVVLGMINLKVVATGSMYLGQTQEPITDTKDPNMKLSQGIQFSKPIKALKFDYKTITGGKQLKATGFGSPTKLSATNSSEAVLLLQKRWEKDGKIYAKRIGTAYARFDKSTPGWVNGFTLPVQYGDITKRSDYKSYKGLVKPGMMYAKNSKGQMVPVQEVGWGEPNDGITHMTMRFSAGDGGAYVGAPGNTLWIDNVTLVE